MYRCMTIPLTSAVSRCILPIKQFMLPSIAPCASQLSPSLKCCVCNPEFSAGHIIGGLSGIFLGWGVGPTLQPIAEQEASSSNSDKQSEDQRPPSSTTMQMQGAASAEPDIVPKDMARINNPVDGIRRVSISAAFLAGLIGIVASTVHDRVGHLPMPKGLGL